MNGAPSTDSTARSRRLFGRLALAAGVLTLVVIAASAFIRHTQAGLACADWPPCYAQIDAHAEAATPPMAVVIARLVHRLAASGALALIIGMLLTARALRPAFRRERRLGLAALVIAAGLALLGIATPGAETPAVPLGNLLGGCLMLATLAALTGALASPDSATPQWPATTSLRPIALALLALAFVQAGLGALIGTQFALTACTELARCPGFAIDEFAQGAALDPFRRLVIVDGHAVAPAGAAGLHVMHRLVGVVLATAALVLAYASRSTNRRAARLLMALALATPLLGATAVVAMPSLAVTVLHNAAAAALIATLAYVAARRTVA
jgi:cytochrome c oxidase assembly protein subunit 15